MSQYDILDMIDDGIPQEKVKESQSSKVIKHNIPPLDMDSSQDNLIS